MTTWSFATAATGQLTGRRFRGDARHLAANTPQGCIAVPGEHDPLCRRVELRPDDFGDAYPVVVPYQPPAPPDDELRTWAWDAAAERWVSAPTTAATARDMRAERDRRIAACDWTQLPDVPAGTAACWATYRQALRDITLQPDFPHRITWPEPPNAHP